MRGRFLDSRSAEMYFYLCAGIKREPLKILNEAMAIRDRNKFILT